MSIVAALLVLMKNNTGFNVGEILLHLSAAHTYIASDILKLATSFITVLRDIIAPTSNPESSNIRPNKEPVFIYITINSIKEDTIQIVINKIFKLGIMFTDFKKKLWHEAFSVPIKDIFGKHSLDGYMLARILENPIIYSAPD